MAALLRALCSFATDDPTVRDELLSLPFIWVPEPPGAPGAHRATRIGGEETMLGSL